jgi:hypothetical protein
VIPVEVVPVVEVVEERHPEWKPSSKATLAVKPQTAEQAYSTTSTFATSRPAVELGFIKQLRDLLRTPKTLQAAVVLTEILGRPRCQRRPGSGL